MLYDTYSESCLLSKIQAYSGIFTSYSDIFSHIATYLEPCVTLGIFRNLPYSESWHTYNPRYIQNSVKEYSDIFRTLCNACIFRIMFYSKFWHSEDPRYIQNPVDLGTFRHIQTYSTMIIIILTL